MLTTVRTRLFSSIALGAVLVCFVGCLEQQSGEGGENGSNKVSGFNFFVTKVKPQFVTTCSSCHAPISQGGSAQAGIAIFSYEPMKARLLNGAGTQSNNLIKYARSQAPVTHTGINHCNNNIEVCSVIAQWRLLEAGDSMDNEPTIGDVTALNKVSGVVSGYAVDPNAQTSSAQVKVYVGNPPPMGTLISTITANQPAVGTTFSGNHGFNFQIPPQYRTGTARTFYFYGVDLGGGPDVLLSRGTFTATLFAPTAQGMTYYTNTVQPALAARCGGCHGTSYTGDYSRMAQPYPDEGGTATNNNLINKARGMAGHGGGTICANINSQPCLELQNWWNDEF